MVIMDHLALSSMRDKINRKQVDEFLVHTFKAHLAARICTCLNLQSTSDVIPHDKSLQ